MGHGVFLTLLFGGFVCGIYLERTLYGPLLASHP